MITNFTNATTSWLATLVRGGRARAPAALREAPPALPLVLYEYESCPMCRRVREALTDLALPVEVRPCPRDGERFRPEAIKRSGKQQFPFLVDPNTGDELLDSERIVAHLYATYGDGRVPRWLTGAGFGLTSTLATLLRGAAGLRAQPSQRVTRSLVLRANESDPRARRVREKLCELEVPYLRTPGSFLLLDRDSEAAHDEPRETIEWLAAQFAV